MEDPLLVGLEVTEQPVVVAEAAVVSEQLRSLTRTQATDKVVRDQLEALTIVVANESLTGKVDRRKRELFQYSKYLIGKLIVLKFP